MNIEALLYKSIRDPGGFPIVFKTIATPTAKYGITIDGGRYYAVTDVSTAGNVQ